MGEPEVLVVWPTRAAQQEALRAPAAARAWSLDELFERLCTWAAFVTSSTRDELAAHLLAARALAREAPRAASTLVAFRRAVAHGQTSARAGAERSALDVEDGGGRGADDERRRWTAWARRIDDELAAAGVVDEPQLLERARALLLDGRLPAFLRGVASVRIEQPLAASPLQAATLAALARRLRVVVTLPDAPVVAVEGGAFDDVEAIVGALARAPGGDAVALERIDVAGAGPLRPLRAALFAGGAIDDAVRAAVPAALVVGADETAEVALVADAVAARRASAPGASVAVAARTGSVLPAVADALEGRGIAVRRRRTLRASPAGRLLLDLLMLRRDGVPRDRLLSVLVNVARRGGLAGDGAAAVSSTLRRAGARTDVDDRGAALGGYRERLERLATRLPGVRADVDAALVALAPVLAAVARLPRSAPLAAHMGALVDVARDVVDEPGPWGGAAVVALIARLARSAARAGGPGDAVVVELSAVLRIVADALAAQPWLDDGDHDAAHASVDAVELLAVGELVGRRFDHVVVVGCVDDNGAPSAGMSGGGTWLSALLTATTSLLLTASTRDARGRARALHPFFLAVADALGVPAAAVLVDRPAGAARTPFADVRAGVADRTATPFAVDGRRLARVFGGALGQRADRPLSATTLEALAACRLRGFVEHALLLDVDGEPGDALDGRVADAIVREALERFERERRVRRVPSGPPSDDDRLRLLALVDDEVARVLKAGTPGHRAAIAATVASLKTNLLRAVVASAGRPLVEGVEPAVFAMPIGAARGGRAPDFAAVPIALDERRTLYLGGVVDRVDEGPGGRLVVQYVPGARAGRRRHESGSSKGSTPLSLLVALRLLEHHRPSSSKTPLYGAAVALADGALVGDGAARQDLRALVVDTDGAVVDDGVGRRIARAVLPILAGSLAPTPGPHCEGCRVRRVCRVIVDEPGAAVGGGETNP